MLGATRALYLAKWHCRTICDLRISSHPVMYIYSRPPFKIYFESVSERFLQNDAGIEIVWQVEKVACLKFGCMWFWSSRAGYRTFPFATMLDKPKSWEVNPKNMLQIPQKQHCIPCATCKGDHTVSATLTGYGICMWTKIQIRLTCSFQRPRQ